jgi:CRP/FNR family transcriptional regulator, putaive post-exponential-phase nitrogen-starvation regulator
VDTIDAYARRYALDELLSADLLARLRLIVRASGELVIGSGEPARDLMFFVEGRTKSFSTLDNGQSILASFSRPFDVFGEAEILSSERYTLSIEAIEDSAFLTLPTIAVKKAAERNCRLFMYLCGRLGAKLSSRIIAESINLRYSVENRLASYLLASMDGEGQVLGTDDLGEIADFIGSSYRQLARVVRRFRDEGILDGKRGRVRVRDLAALEPLAGDLYLRSFPAADPSPRRPGDSRTRGSPRGGG